MAPFTPEQIEQIAREVDHGVRKGVRAVVCKARIGFLLLFLGVAVGFYVDSQHAQDARTAIVNSGRAVSVSGCNRDFRSITNDHNLLRAAERELRAAYKAQEQPISKAQFDNAVRFYREQIEANPLPDCRKAREVVTDDPSKDPDSIPKPLYP